MADDHAQSSLKIYNKNNNLNNKNICYNSFMYKCICLIFESKFEDSDLVE